MNRHFLVSSLAALLCGGLSAQQIIVANQTWVVIPGQQQINTPFFTSNGANPGGFITGTCLTEVGTSTTNSFFQANVSLTGVMQGGPAFNGGTPTQTAAATEQYVRLAFNGVVTTSLSTRMSPASFINQSGTGFNAVANASVSVSCPAFGPLTTSCQANCVPGSGGLFLSTAPMSATATRSSINFWSVTMSATAGVTATMSGTNGLVQVSAICDVSGGVRLN